MDAADSLWALAQTRRVTVAVQTGNEEMMLYGEATLLMRAVSNLIDNAVKYSPPGGTFTVRAGRVRHDDGSDGGLMVSVSDQGPGI
ncbi:ATP-binding protein, partial [Acinetobacter baumannii]